MIRAIIFDFDGLMIDTETPALHSWQQIYAEYHQTISLEQWAETLGTSDGFDPAAHLAALVGAQQPPVVLDTVAVRTRREKLHQELTLPQPLLPGVLAMIAQVDARGWPCAVASSSHRAWVEGWLRHHGIYDRFTCVRTADDVAQTKPAPDLFLSAAACLNIEPAACLVFEDSPNGIRAARAAGMRCVAVPGNIARQVTLPPADLVLRTLADLSLDEIVARVGG